MTTPPIPLTKPYRRQIKLPQFAAPLNVVVSQEGISISVASYGQYCKITWWQMIQVMAPPLYSEHKKAVDHLREQVAMYKTKLAINKGKLKKEKKENKADKIDHAAVWKNSLQEKNCKVCSFPIPKRRLEIIPHADTCVDCLASLGDVPAIKMYRDFSGSPENLNITDTLYLKGSNLDTIFTETSHRISSFHIGIKEDKEW
jgi:RNA polymerase-binding transcription factor DksA